MQSISAWQRGLMLQTDKAKKYDCNYFKDKICSIKLRKAKQILAKHTQKVKLLFKIIQQSQCHHLFLLISQKIYF